MLNFMDYVQQAFSAASGWDRDNSYGALNATARALLDFPIPSNGLTLNFSSLASPNFATFYALSNTGTVDGSLSYLYSSLPLHITSRSKDIPLRRIIPGYRQLNDFRLSDRAWQNDTQQGSENERPATLLCGRLFLPTSHLEAMYLRRLSPNSQIKVSCVSSSQLKSGGSILFLLSRDFGRYSTEWLYSTDSALLGVRGLYNFGPDLDAGTTETENAAAAPISSSGSAPALQKGRFSAGAELYYGILNKSGGMSMGLRFATLPLHTGFPYTMTLTLNPLMGNLSATYAVRAGSALAFCSRFNFNFYSYESDFQLGVELWRRTVEQNDGLEWARCILRQPGRGGWGEPPLQAPHLDGSRDRPSVTNLADGGVVKVPIKESRFDNPTGFANEDTAGVLKARINQDWGVGLLWEGKLKDLLCSFGVTIDFKRRDQIFRGVGVEVQYSS